MKVLPFKIPKTTSESFRVQIDDVPYFYDRLHNHPELQITLVKKGYGTLFVGDSISSFQEGDVHVIGSNVPHVMKNDPVFYEDEEQVAYSISVFFNKESFGKEFFNLPEMQKVKELIKNAERGIRIEGKTKETLTQKIEEIEKAEGFDRFLLLLSILNSISNSEEWNYLSNISFNVNNNQVSDQKLNDVFQYVMDNYATPIGLDEIASVANMSTSAFCRYFKLRTRKTFIRFLNEFRIGTACRELVEKNTSVSIVCYEVGFNNVSNFNRQFKTITGLTPSQYAQKYRAQ